MNHQEINAIASCFIAFSTFLGILSAWVYYLYQIKKSTSVFEVVVWAIIYIDINLLFLYYLKKKEVIK